MQGARVDGERRRERIFNLPGTVVAIIAVLLGVHALRVFVLNETSDDDLLSFLAFVPGRLTFWFNPSAMADHLASLSARDGSLQIAQFLLGNGDARPWTVLTYSLLHADWMHVGVNSVWLAAFGAPVARRFGPIRFLIFFAVAAVAGALLHYAVHAHDLTPVVGASAAVSGAMGAAIRFVFHPDAPLGSGVGFARGDDHRAYRLPPIRLADVWRDRRVVMFVAVWFVVNLAFAFLAQPLQITSGTIAWEAHVGGFLAGLLLFGLFDPPPAAHPAEPDRAAEV
jgi:membrane associated rhomboid family serine protease